MSVQAGAIMYRFAYLEDFVVSTIRFHAKRGISLQAATNIAYTRLITTTRLRRAIACRILRATYSEESMNG